MRVPCADLAVRRVGVWCDGRAEYVQAGAARDPGDR
jgi:hypothetical protein